MSHSTKDKGKGKAKAVSEDDQQLIESFDLGSLMPPFVAKSNDASEKETNNVLSSKMDIDLAIEEDDGLDEEEEAEVEEEEDDDDDDADSLDEWMPKDEPLIEDDEINEFLKNTGKNREKLKTGDVDEFEREMEEFNNNLALTSGIGLNKVKGDAKKRLRAGEIRLSEEVKRQLGEANALYIARDYGSAIDILQDVIKENPYAHPAWNTLGLVHEELGNTPKSLQMRMIAAHLCDDKHLWKELGQKSIENDALKQAIYCYTHALLLDPNDVDALWDRSFLFKQIDLNTKAIEGFQEILKIMPHHFKVINELAQLYRSQGKTKEAIQMYEEAIEYHTNNDDDDEEDEDEEEEDNVFSDKLGYSEINMLSELYLILNDYRRSLDTIKTGLRLIQKRKDETWWIDRDADDDEYLENDEKRAEFPIELRVRMGVCRVYLNQVELGTRHFQYLLQYPPTTYPDLHQDIAYAYYDKRHYELALSVFQKIIDVSNEIEIDLLIRTADCYREVGELDTAVVFYVNVLEEQPDNLDVMMSLATVYEEQGKEEQALELVDFVMKKNREARKQKKSDANKNDEDGNENGDSAVDAANRIKAAKKAKSKKASIFDEQSGQSKIEGLRQRAAERQRQDEEKAYHTQSLFENLEELDRQIGSDLVNADRTLIRGYMKSAQELWEDFSTMRVFYPSDRSVKYQGFYDLRKGKRRNPNLYSVRLEAQSMANRLRSRRIKNENGEEEPMEVDAEEEDEEEKQMREEEEESNRRMADATQFRGVSFDKWLHIVIRYAYILVLSKRVEDAFEVLKKAILANVFRHDEEKTITLHLAVIGCGLLGGDDYMVQSSTRWLCSNYMFRDDVYKIYISVISSGIDKSGLTTTYPQMRYLQRCIRLMDALVAHKRQGTDAEDRQTALDEIRELNKDLLSMNANASTLDEHNPSRYFHMPEHLSSKAIEKISAEVPDEPKPMLLSILAQSLHLAKSPMTACVFFMRAYALAPKDRLNTLSLGITLLHAGMRRTSDNRHMHLMQGMMFIFEYAKLSDHSQEAEFNIGRAFHQLGLTHLAVYHYEKVLCMRSPDRPQLTPDDVYKWPISEEEEEELDKDMDDEFDLKAEAAYNLHLIYVTSGSVNLAQILMLKYCSV